MPAAASQMQTHSYSCSFTVVYIQPLHAIAHCRSCTSGTSQTVLTAYHGNIDLGTIIHSHPTLADLPVADLLCTLIMTQT